VRPNKTFISLNFSSNIRWGGHVALAEWGVASSRRRQARSFLAAHPASPTGLIRDRPHGLRISLRSGPGKCVAFILVRQFNRGYPAPSPWRPPFAKDRGRFHRTAIRAKPPKGSIPVQSAASSFATSSSRAAVPEADSPRIRDQQGLAPATPFFRHLAFSAFHRIDVHKRRVAWSNNHHARRPFVPMM